MIYVQCILACESENVALRLLFWFDLLFVCSVVVCIFSIVSLLSFRYHFFVSFFTRVTFTPRIFVGRRKIEITHAKGASIGFLTALMVYRKPRDVRSFLRRTVNYSADFTHSNNKNEKLSERE